MAFKAVPESRNKSLIDIEDAPEPEVERKDGLPTVESDDPDHKDGETFKVASKVSVIDKHAPEIKKEKGSDRAEALAEFLEGILKLLR